MSALFECIILQMDKIMYAHFRCGTCGSMKYECPDCNSSFTKMSPHVCIDETSTRRFRQAAKLDYLKMSSRMCEHHYRKCRCVKKCRHSRWEMILSPAPQAYCTEDRDPHLLKSNRVSSPGVEIKVMDHLVRWFEAVTVEDRAADSSPGPEVYQVAQASSCEPHT
jgi:hypothetical protein